MVDINMTLVAQVINFSVLVWLLAKFAYKPLTKMLDERSQRIAGDLKKAEEERLSAERLRAEYQEQLNQARVKAQEIVDKAQRQVELDTERQLAELREQIDRMKQTAEEEIAREHAKALTQLRGEVVAMSVAAAGKLIAQNMDNELNSKLVAEFINKLDEEKVGGLPC